MLYGLIVLVVAVLEAGAIAFLLLKKSESATGGARDSFKNLEDELEQKRTLSSQFEELLGKTAELSELRVKVKDHIVAKESLKAERGRVTITQAELDTIETRLRELDEISRELEAASIETKEELNILERRAKELNTKNDALKEQLTNSLVKFDELMTTIELNAQAQEQVNLMKTQLLKTEEQVTTLLTQIQQGNEQYFVLKKRFDALDIEYAQLYEKFAEQQG